MQPFTANLILGRSDRDDEEVSEPVIVLAFPEAGRAVIARETREIEVVKLTDLRWTGHGGDWNEPAGWRGG